MIGSELKSGIETAKGVLSFFPRIRDRLKNWVIYRAAGVPRRAVTITPHQEFRPVWYIDPNEKVPTLVARCDWYIHNITSDPVSMVGTYLHRKQQHQGEVKLFVVKDDFLSPPTISPKKTVEAACYFWVTPPPFSPGTDFETDVDLMDQYGNRYRQWVVFMYDQPDVVA